MSAPVLARPMQAHDLPRELRDLGKKALAAGWEITRTRNLHIRWKSPTGALVYTSGTPSDRRTVRNVAALLKKAGLCLS